MERTVDVATGESVAFSYELAGLGSRFFAVAIDLTIQIAVLVAALLVLLWIGASQSGSAAASAHAAPVSKFAAAVLEGIGIFGVFMLFFGYFIFFEWRFAGRTPGKRLLGIRVVRDGGFPLDFTSAVVRNVVRVVETALGFYLVSAIVTLLSPENRRLGDMAAGTLVVRDNRYERARPVAAAEEPRDDPLVRDLSPAERELVRNYAARRDGLRPASRAALAATIARSIRPKLAVSYEHLGDDDLLVYLAQSALV